MNSVGSAARANEIEHAKREDWDFGLWVLQARNDCIRLCFEPRGRFGIRNELGQQAQSALGQHMDLLQHPSHALSQSMPMGCPTDKDGILLLQWHRHFIPR